MASAKALSMVALKVSSMAELKVVILDDGLVDLMGFYGAVMLDDRSVGWTASYGVVKLDDGSVDWRDIYGVVAMVAPMVCEWAGKSDFLKAG